MKKEAWGNTFFWGEKCPGLRIRHLDLSLEYATILPVDLTKSFQLSDPHFSLDLKRKKREIEIISLPSPILLLLWDSPGSICGIAELPVHYPGSSETESQRPAPTNSNLPVFSTGIQLCANLWFVEIQNFLLNTSYFLQRAQWAS